MAESNGQEKTEQPTPKKLEEAREKGQTAKSMEINSLAIFTFGIISLFMFRGFIGDGLHKISTHIFSSLDILEMNVELLKAYAFKGFFYYITLMTPVFGLLFVIALLAGISQVGLKMSLKAIAPKFNKINPLKGIKEKIFSSRALVEMGKTLLKLSILTGITYAVLLGVISESTGLISLSITEIVSFMGESVFGFIWKIGLAFAAIAIADFAFQKFKFKKDMMMTKQEVKEESKQSDGSPEVKGKIKQIQFSMSRKRMMKELPEADVVITNPTHYAIALKYDMDNDSAPKVVAKGKDHLAQKIKKIAASHNIPLHENRELAQALYKVCDVGDSIPEKLFHSVAKILAYVYQQKNYSNKKAIV